MYISSVFKSKIEEMIAVSPLNDDEFRRVVGMGSHYLSLSAKWDGNDPLFSIKLGDTTVFIFKKID